MDKPGVLYLVATPIGNLEDITLRALRTLAEVDVIAAEDTRITRKLLSHYDIHTKMLAYNQHSKGARIQELLAALLEGKSVAVVSDAGTPGISDPGHDLVKLAIENQLRVEPVPGACAVIAGLIISGLSTDGFIFEGFPPRKESERCSFFTGLAEEERTICLYESPLRLVNTLKSVLECMGNRNVAVAREITKLFEEIFRGTVQEAIDHFEQNKPKGEFVLMIEGALPVDEIDVGERTEQILQNLDEAREEGLSDRDAIRHVSARMRIPRKHVYKLALRQKAARDEMSANQANMEYNE